MIFGSQSYLVSKCFNFRGHSMSVIVEHNGCSYWVDNTAARRAIQQDGRGVQLIDAVLGNPAATKYFDLVRHEFCVEVPICEAHLKEIREELSARYWAEEENDPFLERRLNAILKPLFWAHVNPYLSPPCPARQSS